MLELGARLTLQGVERTIGEDCLSRTPACRIARGGAGRTAAFSAYRPMSSFGARSLNSPQPAKTIFPSPAYIAHSTGVPVLVRSNQFPQKHEAKE